ncbi:MAG: PaaI family thioesterase [Myxococcota bacterium]|nr:PaaI family thioesterase [Myxococcota bacterium]
MTDASITSAAELEALLARARETRDPSVLAAAIPYASVIGLSLAQDGEGDAIVARMRYADDLIGDSTIPALHGGTIAALLESTAILSVLWRAEAPVLPRTITITIDYLRTGRPVDTLCRASIVRQGRRIVVVSVRAFQEDEAAPIATAIVHVLCTTDERAAPEPR